MKHLYRLGKAALVACLLVFGANTAHAQTSSVAAESNNPNENITPVPVLQNAELLWEQQRVDTGGIVTGYFDGVGGGAWSADSFEINEPASITMVTMLGFQNNATLLDGVLIDFTLYIFANDFGTPAGHPEDEDSWLFSVTLAPGDAGLEIEEDGNLYTFMVDIEAATGSGLFLEADRYWVVASPNHDMLDLDGATRWNWAQGEDGLGPFYLIDPDDLFGAGFTSWTNGATIIDWDTAGLTFSVFGVPGEPDDPELGPFSLLSPPDGTELTVEEGTEDPVVIEWEASENAESYTWVANAAGEGFDEPLLSLPSDGGGSATQLTLTTGAIYDVLLGLGFEDGDTADLDWTVMAALGDDTMMAEQVWGVSITLGGPVSTEPIETVKGFALEQNYPNPFNPTTNISFTLPEASDVSIEVFNMQGQRIATLQNGMMSAGSHNVQFDATNLSSGIYLYRMTAGSFTATNKMMLVK